MEIIIALIFAYFFLGFLHWFWDAKDEAMNYAFRKMMERFWNRKFPETSKYFLFLFLFWPFVEITIICIIFSSFSRFLQIAATNALILIINFTIRLR